MSAAGHARADGGGAGGTISVAIATFNGARYLTEQLDSIAAQTRPPDEVVIADDCSTDDTMMLAGRFAARAPFPVRLIRHPRNIGILENFYAAFEATSGDILFSCDQDDVWHPDKIRRIMAALRPGTMLAMHQSAIVGPGLEPQGRIAPGNARYGRYAFPADAQAVHGYAHQMAFRRAVLPLMQRLRGPIEAIRPASFAHDFDRYIPFCASLLGDLAVLADPLVHFRRHATATSPAGAALPPEPHRKRTAGALLAKACYLIARDAEESALRAAIVRHAVAEGLLPTATAATLDHAFAAGAARAAGRSALLADRRALPARLAATAAALAAYRRPGFTNARPLRAASLTLLAAIAPRPATSRAESQAPSRTRSQAPAGSPTRRS